MQITYEQYQRQTGGRQTARKRARRPGRSAPLSRSELRRLKQLAVSLALFLAVFAGKGVFPGQMEDFGRQLQSLMSQTTDFKSAFSQLGSAISAGEPLTEAMGDWCVAVFSPSSVVRVVSTQPWEHAPSLRRELDFLSKGVDSSEERLAHRLQEAPDSWLEEEQPEPITFADAVSRAEQNRTTQSAYNGPELPANATMDAVELGLEEMMTPVLGVVSSPYGYREHPVDGEYKFHAGVDLAADKHTDILAFADGVVDFVGTSEAYGNYVQLRHANGVTSFYAHCDELLLPKGTPVSAGDVIARVGETGNATGPHLHLEIKADGVLVNPLNYIETKPAE